MEFIIDPADNKSYSIYSKNGLELLNEYLQLYKEGGRKAKKAKSSKNKIKKKTKVKKIKSPKKSPKKFIGDPDKRICEDYLRIYRYYRFLGIFKNPQTIDEYDFGF